MATEEVRLVANRVCGMCGAPLKLTIENGSAPWPATLAAMEEGKTTFTGYAEHWTCGDYCGYGEIMQVPA